MSVNVQVTATTAQATKEMAAFTETSAAGLNKVAAAGKQAAASTETIGSRILENNRKLKSAIGGLALNATLFAGPQAQQFIYPLILMQKELKGLASAAKIAGLSIPGVGVSILGVSAIIATAVQGVKLYQAEMLELASGKAVQEQFGKFIPNLKKLLAKEVLFGTIDAYTAGGLMNRLTDVETKSSDEQQKVFDEVRGLLSKIQSEGKKSVAGVEFDKYLKETSAKFLEGAAKEKDELAKMLDEIVVKGTELATAAGRDPNELLGVVNPILKSRNAAIDAKELQQRLDTERKLIEEKRRAQMEEDEARLKEYDHQQKMLAMELDRQQQARIDKIQSDPFLSDAEKYDQLAAEGIPKDQLGADPQSLVQQWRVGFAVLRSEWGTLQQQIARGFFDVVNSGVNLVTDGLTSLIFQTDGWRQKLAQIPQIILQGIVGSIIQMGLRWITTQILMAAVGTSIGASQTAASVAQAYVVQTAWAPAAYAMAVATYGSAAYVGAAATIGGLAATTTAFAGSGIAAREKGGPVTDGQPYLVGEKGPELFVPGADGQIVSNRNMQAMSARGGSSRSDKSEVNVKTIVVADIKQAMLEVLASRSGERIIVQTLQGKRMELGFPTSPT